MQSKPYTNAMFPLPQNQKLQMFHYFPLILCFHYQHNDFQNGDQSTASICKEGTT